MYQIKKIESSEDNNYSPKAQDPTTAVTDNKKAPPLEVGHYKKYW